MQLLQSEADGYWSLSFAVAPCGWRFKPWIAQRLKIIFENFY